MDDEVVDCERLSGCPLEEEKCWFGSIAQRKKKDNFEHVKSRKEKR